jgi:serine/threonine-protein kinase HipA
LQLCGVSLGAENIGVCLLALELDGNGRWCLSPAYDPNPIPIEGKVSELATWISEEGPDASLDLARNAAKYFAVKKAEADAIIKQQKAVVADWRKTASRLSMSAADTAAYASAFSASGR